MEFHCNGCTTKASCNHRERCLRGMPIDASVDPIQKTEAQHRKEAPVYSGFIAYFPDAMEEVARVSFVGNEQHNPGQPLHWDRNKSQDELDALSRHLKDHAAGDKMDGDGCRHLAKVAWRAMAALQKAIEGEG